MFFMHNLIYIVKYMQSCTIFWLTPNNSTTLDFLSILVIKTISTMYLMFDIFIFVVFSCIILYLAARRLPLASFDPPRLPPCFNIFHTIWEIFLRYLLSVINCLDMQNDTWHIPSSSLICHHETQNHKANGCLHVFSPSCPRLENIHCSKALKKYI